jgi:hypothetical protein
MDLTTVESMARESAERLARELRLQGVLVADDADDQQRLVADAFYRFARGLLAIAFSQAATLP